jgi:dihydropteroate synthase
MKSAAESNRFSRNYSLNIHGRLVDLRKHAVMGILNITPDSFFTESRLQTEESIVQRAGQMLDQGAAFLDVGGYSTRPGAGDVPLEEEKKRVCRAIEAILRHFPQAVISCDTFRSEVAEAAISSGAAMVNDVSGGNLDENMFGILARHKVPYILMHMRGTPQTMATLTQYENLHVDIISSLQQKLVSLVASGLTDVIIDPGFGFAKSGEQGFELMNKLELFHVLERPLLVGISRKSMIWKTLNIPAEEALNGTTALNTIALLKGAAILRVHDVKEAVQVVTLVESMRKYEAFPQNATAELSLKWYI